MEHIATILGDGTQYPNIFTIAGAIALALFIMVQIIRCALEKRLLSEFMNPVWAPALTVFMFAVLLGIDHLRAMA